MRLYAPTSVVFLVSLVVAIIALVGKVAAAASLGSYAFCFSMAACVLLAAGNLLKSV